MSREFRHILRFMGTDLDGSKKVIYGISKIRGVGPNLAQAVVKVAKVNPDARIGALSEAEMSRVEDAIRDPLKHGIPPRMVNRRKDIETGRDMHLVGPDLVLKIKSDVDLMKDIRRDRKSTRLNSSHTVISYAVFCLKKKNSHLYSS